ncbi:MAG: DUF411 domain-containing protein [Anaerolineales bacterium]
MGHLLSNGFEVETIDLDYGELDALKVQYGVPPKLFSCHTALVDGYVIEGHVPADVIDALLSERPNIIGLGVPGMPAGSPGMEAGDPVPYDIVAFTADGEIWVHASR